MHSHTHCPPQPYNSLNFGNEKNPNIHSHYHQKGVRETEKNSKDLTHLSCFLVHTCARTRASTRTHTRSSCPSAAAQSLRSLFRASGQALPASSHTEVRAPGLFSQALPPSLPLPRAPLHCTEHLPFPVRENISIDGPCFPSINLY